MARIPNGIETLPKILIVCIGRTNVTDDRQTDRQTTDGRPMTYSEHELEFTFAKNLGLSFCLSACMYVQGESKTIPSTFIDISTMHADFWIEFYSVVTCQVDATWNGPLRDSWIYRTGNCMGLENDGLEFALSNWSCYWRFALNLHTTQTCLSVRLRCTRCVVIGACVFLAHRCNVVLNQAAQSRAAKTSFCDSNSYSVYSNNEAVSRIDSSQCNVRETVLV